jgi:hypothetical protein
MKRVAARSHRCERHRERRSKKMAADVSVRCRQVADPALVVRCQRTDTLTRKAPLLSWR